MSAIVATDVVGSWPPRKLLTLTGLTGSSVVDVYRVVGGARTPVRGLQSAFIGTTTTVVVDAELPFGLPVSYELRENLVLQDTDGPSTTTLTGGKVALTDAITGLAAEVVIMSHDDLVRDGEATVFAIDGRNYVVADPLAQPTATWEYFTDTITAYDDLITLLQECTYGIVQQRQPGGYDGVDAYLAPLLVSTSRFSQDGSDPRRLTKVRMAECLGWPYTLTARGYTLQDVADVYTGSTLADLAGDYATLLLLGQGEFE